MWCGESVYETDTIAQAVHLIAAEVLQQQQREHGAVDYEVFRVSDLYPMRWKYEENVDDAALQVVNTLLKSMVSQKLQKHKIP